LGFGFVPVRPPPPAVAAAAPCRTGARRRASRQMKNEIPARTASAPIPIPIAVPLLSPVLPELDVLVGSTWGVVVVVWEGEIGTPGENGLPDCPGGVAVIGAEDEEVPADVVAVEPV
jgi:hypothetical protein